MRRIPRWRTVGAAAVVALAVAMLVPATSNAAEPVNDDAGPGCRFLDVPVPASVLDEQMVPAPGANVLAKAVNPGKPDLTVHGRLCLPHDGQVKTVMLALHGITYNNGYWNVGFEPEKYNYSRYMTDAGYAIFAIDRLGAGKSSKPPAALVTLDAQAAMVHQLIGKLRHGDIGGHRFERVVLVGYSYGSATTWRETSKYNDADAIITTAWGSTFQNGPLLRVFSTFQPAQLDPQFRDRPPGYLTLGPTGRDQDYFYDLSNVDPKMLRYSATELDDTLTAGEVASFYPRFGAVPLGQVPGGSTELELPLPHQTKSITVPTFLVNGTGELFFCGVNQQHCTSSQELQRQESKYFSEAACFRAAVIPNSGHNLNLQRNAPFAFETMRTFADEVLGPDGDNLDHYRATCSGISGSHVRPGPARFGAL
ncbi:alpha/beta hydrolase [Pseudonocardia spinosispora]|uniref:alpha/beta hydrolase n=1 Tax=Pseudonocardia spinosispora TaxID=103441 RepID=UPI0012EB4637|nr:alpha/beta fold hydrolase [Pseudonocardia spinosispora]